MPKLRGLLNYLSKGQTRIEKIAEKVLENTVVNHQRQQPENDFDAAIIDNTAVIDSVVEKRISPIYYGMQALLEANIITMRQLDEIMSDHANAEQHLLQIDNAIIHQAELINQTIANHRAEIIHATKQSAAAYERKMNELNNTVMPVMNAIMDAWTNVNIQGFENEREIVQLKNELDNLIATSTDRNAILVQTKKLKDAKTLVTLQRQNFDNVLHNAQHIVNGAGSLALLFGKPRLANEVQVIGGSALKLGTLIAGYCGYGTLAAGVNPFAAVSMVLGCAGDIAMLGRREPDSNQLILEQMQQMIGQMYSEMHERFDEVMQVFDLLSRKQLQQFLTLSSNQQALLNRLELQDKKFTRRQDTLQNYSVEILQTLNNMLQSKQKDDKEKILLEMRENVNKKVALAEESKQKGNGYYDEARSHILNYIRTSGSGITHKDLIGEEVTASQFAVIDAMIDIHPYFSLQTIYSYCKSLNVDALNMPNLMALQDKLNTMFANQARHALTPVVTLGHLLSKENNQGNVNAESLLRFLRLERNIQINKIVAPLYINGRWSLLVVDTQQNEAFYIAHGNNEEVNQIVINILKMRGLETENIHVKVIESTITPSKSHIWLFESIKRLLLSHELSTWSEEVKRLTITTEIQTEHQVTQIKDAIQPSNPIVLQYLVFKMLELTYVEYKKLGSNEENLSISELAGIQDMLHVSDSLYQLFSQLSQPELFTKLINDYIATRNEFAEILNEDLIAFDRVISNEMNIKTKEAAKNAYYSVEIDAFLNDEISVSAQYGDWYNRASFRNWINSKHTRDCRYNVDHGNTDSAHLANAYVTQQIKQIATYKHNYVSSRQTTFNNLSFTNNYSTFSDHQISKIELPICVRPLIPTDAIWMPAPEYLFNYLPEHVKPVLIKAQGCLIGHFCYSTEITTDKIFININFKLPDAEFPFARLEAAHDPSFFTGKEKIWWDVIGESCAQSKNGNLTLVTSQQADGRNTYHSYAYLPVMGNRAGLLSRAASHNNLFRNVLDNNSANVDGNLTIIQQRLNAFKAAELQNRYARELLEKLQQKSESRLGLLLVRLNAQYKILKLLSELLFSTQMKDTNSIIYQFFNQRQFVVNRESAYAHLTNNKHQFMGNCLLTDLSLERLKNEVHRLLNLTLGLGRIPEVDVLQSHLLDCANDMAVNLVQRRTNSEQARFYKTMNELVDQGVSRIMTTLATQPERLPELLSVYNKAAEIKRRVESAFESNERVSIHQLLEGVKRELLAIEAPAPTVRPVTGNNATMFGQPNAISLDQGANVANNAIGAQSLG